MAIIIYTYSNPYQLNQEQYWALIQRAFQLCASQTLVNGLCDQYSEFYKGQLTTMQRFINNLYKHWKSDQQEIGQQAALDNIITYMDFQNCSASRLSNETIKASLKRNRSYILQSLRLIIELGMKPENIREDVLTDEQKCVIALYKEILATKNTWFRLQQNFSQEEVDTAIRTTIQDALHGKEKAGQSINTDTIVIHGIHQFSPIMLRTLEVLSKYKNVIVLFNYQPAYKQVYQTWLNVYSCFESKVNFSSQNFVHVPQAGEGEYLVDQLSAVTDGNIPMINLSQPIEVTEFDNPTEFAGYVAKKFETAAKQQEDDGSKHPALYYMDEQIYAANSAVNQILKIYFPEQFGEREFLDYPLGHFFLAITDMWDPETKTMHIRDLHDVIECLSCGIIAEDNAGQLASIFAQCQLYFARETTLKGVVKKLKRLKRRVAAAEEDSALARVSYFNVTEEDLIHLSRALKELDTIVLYFFADFNDQRNDFTTFYRKIADVLTNRVLVRSELDAEFRDIVARVLERLDEVKQLEVNASFACLRETMQLYLRQLPAEGKGAHWIVRNFEQIDGDVLRKHAAKHDICYHFACLSDQNMSITHKDEFPWPLDRTFFAVAQAPVDWKYQVYVTSRQEYKNFRRYAFIYGLSFCKAKIKLSYIRHENGTENELYYVLKFLQAKIKPYKPEKKANYGKDTSYIDIISAKRRNFSAHDLMKFRLCKYRFLLEAIIADKTIYRDDFLLRKYLVILLENQARRHFAGSSFVKNMVRSYLMGMLNELSDDFPFIGHIEQADAVRAAMDYLDQRIVRCGKFPVIKSTDDEYMILREEFLSIPTRGKYSEKYKEIFKPSTQEEVNACLTEERLAHEKYLKTLNVLCDQCADREICIEPYNRKK